MERTQFTFYESFATALRRIRKKSDRCAAYDAIVEYALYGREPDMETLPNAAAIALELIRPNLDASRRKAAGGQKGSSAKDSGKTGARYGEDTDNKKENKKENENEREIEKESYTTAPVVPPPQKRLNRAQRRELEERERQRRADEQLLRNVAELPRILAKIADPP